MPAAAAAAAGTAHRPDGAAAAAIAGRKAGRPAGRPRNAKVGVGGPASAGEAASIAGAGPVPPPPPAQVWLSPQTAGADGGFSSGVDGGAWVGDAAREDVPWGQPAAAAEWPAAARPEWPEAAEWPADSAAAEECQWPAGIDGGYADPFQHDWPHRQQPGPGPPAAVWHAGVSGGGADSFRDSSE